MECGVKDFILSHYISNLSICDELIDYYKKSNKKFKGTVYDVANSIDVEDTSKLSTEVILEESLIRKLYLNELKNITDEYVKKYFYSYYYGSFGINENIKIQHYKKNEGYKVWHTEKAENIFPYVTRHLVFMTYLNDVDDEGETEFFYQQIKVKPKKGLTLIWPAQWTHTHRGIVSPSQEKFIVTGWFNFI